jgi:hypothetical protein
MSEARGAFRLGRVNDPACEIDRGALVRFACRLSVGILREETSGRRIRGRAARPIVAPINGGDGHSPRAAAREEVYGRRRPMP